MDPRSIAERGEPPGSQTDPDAIEFVRFCYRRRRVGWPELYDEMCAVAGRGLYRGYGSDDLGKIGIGLTLFEMPGLALMVHRVVSEDQERRRLTAEALRPSHTAPEPAPSTPVTPALPAVPAPIAATADPEPSEAPMKLVALSAGA